MSAYAWPLVATLGILLSASLVGAYLYEVVIAGIRQRKDFLHATALQQAFETRLQEVERQVRRIDARIPEDPIMKRVGR